MSQGKMSVECTCGNNTFYIEDVMYGCNTTDPGTTVRTIYCTKCHRIIMAPEKSKGDKND
jgi:hypothetical protein